MARSGSLLAVFLALLLAGCAVEQGAGPALVRAERLLMGTRFGIRVISADQAAARDAVAAAFAEVARVEALLSEWQETSEISAVNRAAGEHPVAVGPELLAVVERSLWASRLTGGAFDVTFAACGGLWSVREARVPAAAEIAACLPRVGYQRMVVDLEAATIFLPRAGMRIGISGIGKGYGVDRAVAVLEAAGIDHYIVDGGGDVRLKGRKGERPWLAGIAHPRRPGELYATLHPAAGAIVTSGDYQQYFERDGVRHHHILDPATGEPARRAVAVTVIAPTAMDADALATGLFVMGPEAGLPVVESLPGVEALYFAPDLAVRTSSGFPELSVLRDHSPPSRREGS